MKFSSGWSTGPAFDEQALTLEIAGEVSAAADAQQVAAEFEAEHAHARLSVLPLDPVVFTGEIAITGITELIETFSRVGHRCTIEFYDPDSVELLTERPAL